MTETEGSHEVRTEWGCITSLMEKISDVVDSMEGGWGELIDMIIAAADDCGKEEDPATLFFTLYQFLFRTYYRIKANPVKQKFDQIEKVTVKGVEYFRIKNYSYKMYKWAKQNNFLWLASNGFIDIPVEKLSDSQRRAFEKRVTP